jgi:mxaL protein
MIAISDWRFWMRCAALVLLVAAIFVPPVTVARAVYDVVAVLDITGSMNVRDQRLDGAEASRLAMEKRALRRLLGRLPCGSRLGVAIFVEKQPFLLFEPVEVCENFAPLDEEIAAIDWRMGWDSESHIAEGLLAAMRMAGGLHADLVFLTDGQETPPLWWSAAPDFAPVRGIAGGLVVGVGGKALSPIPKFDGYGREIGVFKPGDVPVEKAGMFRGHEHLSAVDEPHLRALASSTGLHYRHLDGEDALFPDLADLVQPRLSSGTVPINWMFGLAGLSLLIAAALAEHTQKFFGSFFQKRTA